MRRTILAALAAVAFIAPVALDATPASAATYYSCTSTSYDPECQYANKYVCSGSTFWAYRFWQFIYNFNTGQVVSRYKETMVDRYTNGRLVQRTYFNGWSYSPCQGKKQ